MISSCVDIIYKNLYFSSMTEEKKECTQKECPQCHALMPVHAEYLVWCAQCGWNLNPRQQTQKRRTLIETFYASLGKKQSKALFEEFKNADIIKPKLSFSRVTAFILSSGVHGITLALFGLGIFLISLWMNFLIIGMGLICVLVAFILRPRLTKPPKNIASQNDYPALYQLVDRVSEALGVPKNYSIAINEEFNAAFNQVGWKRRKIYYIGLPLWSVLDNHEKIALMAHEVAHKVNGDAMRGFLVQTAIQALNDWHYFLYPDVIWDDDEIYGHGFAGFLARVLMAFVNLSRLLLSKIPRSTAYLLAHLLWRDSQRAEYLADYLAANVIGTKPVTSMLDKLHFQDEFVFTMQKVALNLEMKSDFFEEFKNRVAHIPPGELERIRRLQEVEQSALDTTHPPTVYRIKMLKEHPITTPKVSSGDFRFFKIEEELLKMKAPIQAKLIDLCKAQLYRQ